LAAAQPTDLAAIMAKAQTTFGTKECVVRLAKEFPEVANVRDLRSSTIEITFTPEGYLRKVEVIASSGLPLVDDMAVRLVSICAGRIKRSPQGPMRIAIVLNTE
jgi:outer membrane biosynthesis protein TonB